MSILKFKKMKNQINEKYRSLNLKKMKNQINDKLASLNSKYMYANNLFLF